MVADDMPTRERKSSMRVFVNVRRVANRATDVQFFC